MPEETTESEWLKTLDNMDKETDKPAALTDTAKSSGDDGIVLYKILDGLNYTPMLGMQSISEHTAVNQLVLCLCKFSVL